MGSVENTLKDHPEYRAGLMEADISIQNGKLIYRLFGKLDQITCEAAKDILLSQYNIDLEISNRSIISIERAAHDEGFNARMQEEFVKRFDLDVVNYILKEAEKRKKA
jgi:hypothetical protein